MLRSHIKELFGLTDSLDLKEAWLLLQRRREGSGQGEKDAILPPPDGELCLKQFYMYDRMQFAFDRDHSLIERAQLTLTISPRTYGSEVGVRSCASLRDQHSFFRPTKRLREALSFV